MADINKKDRDGQTALMHASKNGYLDIVQLLLANEADVNTENNNGKNCLVFMQHGKNIITLLTHYLIMGQMLSIFIGISHLM